LRKGLSTRRESEDRRKWCNKRELNRGRLDLLKLEFAAMRHEREPAMVVRKEVFERDWDFQVDKTVLALIEKKSEVCLIAATIKVIVGVSSTGEAGSKLNFFPLSGMSFYIGPSYKGLFQSVTLRCVLCNMCRASSFC
jgi:hypothetical protein